MDQSFCLAGVIINGVTTFAKNYSDTKKKWWINLKDKCFLFNKTLQTHDSNFLIFKYNHHLISFHQGTTKMWLFNSQPQTDIFFSYSHHWWSLMWDKNLGQICILDIKKRHFKHKFSSDNTFNRPCLCFKLFLKNEGKPCIGLILLPLNKSHLPT